MKKGGKYPFDEKIADLALKSNLAVEVFQYPGEVLVIPSNWGHATLNLCETFSIAQEFGCLDDHNYRRLFILPVMQKNSPSFKRKAGVSRY